MASPFSGSVAEVCEALVATPSEYGDEELIAGLVEERCRELGVVTSGAATRSSPAPAAPGPAWRWSGTSTRCRTGPAARRA